MNGEAAKMLTMLKVYMGVASAIGVVLMIFCVLIYWKLFKKAGKKGWHSLIPFLNIYDMFDIAYPGKGFKMFLMLVPIFNIYISIKFIIDFVKAYGGGVLEIVLTMFTPVGLIMLAFSDKYQYVYGDGFIDEKSDEDIDDEDVDDVGDNEDIDDEDDVMDEDPEEVQPVERKKLKKTSSPAIMTTDGRAQLNDDDDEFGIPDITEDMLKSKNIRPDAKERMVKKKVSGKIPEVDGQIFCMGQYDEDPDTGKPTKYTEDDLIDGLSKKQILQYAYIRHEKDSFQAGEKNVGIKPASWYVVGKSKKGVKQKDLAKWFKVPEDNIEIINNPKLYPVLLKRLLYDSFGKPVGEPLYDAKDVVSDFNYVAAMESITFKVKPVEKKVPDNKAEDSEDSPSISEALSKAPAFEKTEPKPVEDKKNDTSADVAKNRLKNMKDDDREQTAYPTPNQRPVVNDIIIPQAREAGIDMSSSKPMFAMPNPLNYDDMRRKSRSKDLISKEIYYISGGGEDERYAAAIIYIRNRYQNTDDNDIMFDVDPAMFSLKDYAGQPAILWLECTAETFMNKLSRNEILGVKFNHEINVITGEKSFIEFMNGFTEAGIDRSAVPPVFAFDADEICMLAEWGILDFGKVPVRQPVYNEPVINNQPVYQPPIGVPVGMDVSQPVNNAFADNAPVNASVVSTGFDETLGANQFIEEWDMPDDHNDDDIKRKPFENDYPYDELTAKLENAISGMGSTVPVDDLDKTVDKMISDKKMGIPEEVHESAMQKEVQDEVRNMTTGAVDILINNEKMYDNMLAKSRNI